jgi:hypothetical protein
MVSKNKAVALISNADCDKITNKKPVMFIQRALKNLLETNYLFMERCSPLA